MRTPLYHLLSVLLLFFITTAYAQHPVYVGAKAGISIPNLSGGNDHINPLQNGYKSSLRGDFGILAEFHIKNKLSIQTGIEYLQEGGKNVGMQAFINPYPNLADQPYLYANYRSEVKLDYLMIPVLAKFTFPLDKKWNFYLNAGGWGGIALSAESITDGKSRVFLDAEGKQEQDVFPDQEFEFTYREDVKDSIKTFNAGVIMAIGFSYNIGNGKIFIEGGGNYGFIDLAKNKLEDANYAGALTAQLGYAYRLKPKRKKEVSVP